MYLYVRFSILKNLYVSDTRMVEPSQNLFGQLLKAAAGLVLPHAINSQLYTTYDVRLYPLSQQMLECLLLMARMRRRRTCAILLTDLQAVLLMHTCLHPLMTAIGSEVDHYLDQAQHHQHMGKSTTEVHLNHCKNSNCHDQQSVMLLLCNTASTFQAMVLMT